MLNMHINALPCGHCALSAVSPVQTSHKLTDLLYAAMACTVCVCVAIARMSIKQPNNYQWEFCFM